MITCESGVGGLRGGGGMLARLCVCLWAREADMPQRETGANIGCSSWQVETQVPQCGKRARCSCGG